MSTLNKAQIALIQQENNRLFIPLMKGKRFFTAEDLKKNPKIFLAGAQIRELTQKLIKGG